MNRAFCLALIAFFFSIPLRASDVSEDLESQAAKASAWADGVRPAASLAGEAVNAGVAAASAANPADFAAARKPATAMPPAPARSCAASRSQRGRGTLATLLTCFCLALAACGGVTRPAPAPSPTAMPTPAPAPADPCQASSDAVLKVADAERGTANAARATAKLVGHMDKPVSVGPIYAQAYQDAVNRDYAAHAAMTQAQAVAPDCGPAAVEAVNDAAAALTATDDALNSVTPVYMAASDTAATLVPASVQDKADAAAALQPALDFASKAGTQADALITEASAIPQHA